MMKYKMLALDLDGTLTNSQKIVTPATVAAIGRAAELGVKIVLASGRPPFGMLSVAESVKLGEIGGIILAFNGGVITDYAGGKTLVEKTVPNEYLPEIEQFAADNGVDGTISYTPRELPCTCTENYYAQIESRLTNMPFIKTDSLAKTMAGKSVWKIILPGDGAHMAEIEPLLAKQFAGRLSVGRSEAYFLEARPLNVNKASGLAELGAALGIAQEEIIACGDSFNDIEMVSYAGLGVAMGNAQQCIKDNADYITKTNDEDGIAAVIEKFILQGQY